MSSRVRGSISEIKAARKAAKNEKARAPGRGRRSSARILAFTVGKKDAPSEPSLRRPSSRATSRAAASRAEEPSFGPRRIAIVSFVLFVFAVIVLGRAAELQLLDGDTYGGVVERQASLSANIQAKRGVIKDRHASELAITVDVDTIFAEPKKIDPAEKDDVAKTLASILGMPREKILRKLSRDRSFTYLARRVDPQIAAKVRELDLRGIGTTPEPKRFYSNRELAAHVLGFSSFDGEGGAGIEKQLNGELRGKSYEVPALRDALGNSIFTQGFVAHSVLEGADVTLTIDRQIQFAAEEALKDTVEQYRAKGGVAIVLEVKSGEVLAMASYPTYNPNNMKGSTPDRELNRAVAAVFEPGSTMKMVTIAGAVEDGTIRPDDRIDCEGGHLKIGRRSIGDSHKGYGELTVAEVMKVSSNVCAAKIGMQMGRTRLHHWLKAFGLGEKTGLELPGELRGLIRPAETWREIALANIAFGQGISVTPIQIAAAGATIANGGKRIAPRIVKEIAAKSGERDVTEQPHEERVLTEKTARAVTAMMEEVTKKGGTAEVAAIPGFRVAGKTGTAQKIDPVSKAYSHELYVSSFIGFVPADRPDVSILVMIDEPKGAVYGGVVAAPAWRRIALAALSAREVFPEDEAAREAFFASYRVEPASGSRLGKAEPPAGRESIASGITGPDEGDDAGAPQAAAGGEAAKVQTVDSPDESPATTDDALSAEAQAMLGLAPDRGGGRMPNFAGLELREVLNRSAEVHCDPVLTGTGRVVAQTPKPGEVLPAGARCELKLSPNG